MHDDEHWPAELRELTTDYEIEAELGRGSSAVVYRARDRGLERPVAIKLVRAHRVDDELLERTAQEARLLASLPHHPNIVAIYAVRRLARRSLALVMQLVPGRTLRELLAQEGALPAERAATLLRDLARALHFAHGHGIVHRDVKPENVYLDAASGRALLSDFGSAVQLEADARLTRAGAVIGTPAYMSPEQIGAQGVDARSDLYSLGLVGWEALTGRFPWGTANLYEILYRQRHGDLPLLDAVRPELPVPLVNAVEGALERDRDARWPDAAAFLSALLAPPDTPRIPPRRVRAAVPAGLSTLEVGEQHARTLPAGGGATSEVATPEVATSEVATSEVAARDGAASDVPATAPAGLDPAWVRAHDAAAVPDTAESPAWAVDVPDTAEGLAWASPSRAARAPRRRTVAGALLLLVAVLAVATMARGAPDVPSGERSAAGEVGREEVGRGERTLAEDLAAATAAPPAPATAPNVPPAPATAARGDGIEARCATPGLPNQRACLLARLIDYDAPLNAVYGELVAELRARSGAGAGTPDPPIVARLRTAQRQWLVDRDGTCRRRGQGREGALWAEARARCLGELGEQRATQLRAELDRVRG